MAEPTDPKPADQPPIPWLKIPVVQQVIGVAIFIALSWLAAKTGITPLPVPVTVPVPQPQAPGVLVLHYHDQPAQTQPLPSAALGK